MPIFLALGRQRQGGDCKFEASSVCIVSFTPSGFIQWALSVKKERNDSAVLTGGGCLFEGVALSF